ncbi:maleylpyruvate isomerase family mycothiol-dependent enzyme [Streptomyces kaniharaensis]|uniref:Maleylpyruvate isomerase family mycothiol-dependent enzyme n=1 Tax=Streptomyces kaniharaensis TaxID=212423 RepID=A0A6N7KR68_9ACTN|nr:maleylpyruvate isomerase family mycothiol-dependent enzyme [Streptomyces kaniharaensis]MQS13255.1 maleylpyruvate isomerase family mycothiol-dependent enzyme [Streptomyces kaniharaensis]
MPPKSRTYQPQKLRAALAAQNEALRAVVHRLTAPDLDRPTRLGSWRVRELLAHLGLALGHLPATLDKAEPDGPPLSLARYAELSRTLAEAVDTAVTEHAATGFAGPPEEVAAAFDRPLDAVRAVLDGTVALEPERRVDVLGGRPMVLTDYLVTRLVEAVVHADDLADALGVDGFPHDRQALAAVTRMLADALAARAPGGAVELRIPPYAVVQAVEGPRHTRGTPPNVVETDPLTWIRLATGRTAWTAAVDAAAVSASGERSDLSAYLPVLG